MWRNHLWKQTLYRGGFTLIELLIVMALMSVVAMAIYGNFNSAIRIWQAFQGKVPLEDTALFLQKAEREFYGAFRYSDIPFTGGPEKVTFATFISTDPLLGGERAIGEVSYSYNNRRKAIEKEVRNVSQVYKEKKGIVSTLHRDVLSFEASYFIFDVRTEEYMWVEEWEEEETLPVAVRLNFVSSALGEHRSFTRTFMIASGGFE